ncbi:hypothetical protein ES705_48473 [subsurface metagenome]
MLAGNVAYISAKAGSKVLLVDGDPQGSVSSWFLQEALEYELADVLQGTISLEKALVELGENLCLVPTFGIGGSLKTYAENALEKEPLIFQDLGEGAERVGFDLVIYDLSPGIGRLERCILLGCDEVIAPLTPEYLSLDGVDIFSEFLGQVRKGFKKYVKHEKIVLNLLNKSFRRHEIYRDKIRELGYQLFEVGQDAKIPESQIMHLSLLEYDPHSRVIPELERLSKSLREG